MYNWKELLDYINGEIAGMSFERQPAELYAPIRYVLSMGGKRIRPVLMLMAYNLYKEKVEVIRSQAMAIEIYHNYTLLHDDLMDRADMRRGMATVHKKWDDNAAILSGDSMLSWLTVTCSRVVRWNNWETLWDCLRKLPLK